jgi:hypothetical protein
MDVDPVYPPALARLDGRCVEIIPLEPAGSSSSGKCDRLAWIVARARGRTGLWSTEIDRLFVAWPSRDGHPPEIHMLVVPSGA